MLKDRKNIGIIILIVVVITALMILIFKTISRNKEKQQTISSTMENESVLVDEKKDKNVDSILSNNTTKTGMNELSTTMEGKTDKCKVVVNGEKITEREIAYIDFQINNTVLNEQQEKKDAINEAIKEYVVVQDAKQRNIFLTEEENKTIEERTKKQFAKDKDGMNSTLNTFQMDYDEFLKFHIAKIKRLEIGTKWTLHINEAIRKGELNTKNEAFNKKCKQYRDNKTESQNISLLFELVDEYKEYLKDEAKIEYID